LQTGLNAAAHFGFYSAQEFEFDVLNPCVVKWLNWGAPVCIENIETWLCSVCCGKGLPIMRGNAMLDIFSAAVPLARKINGWRFRVRRLMPKAPRPCRVPHETSATV